MVLWERADQSDIDVFQPVKVIQPISDIRRDLWLYVISPPGCKPTDEYAQVTEFLSIILFFSQSFCFILEVPSFISRNDGRL